MCLRVQIHAYGAFHRCRLCPDLSNPPIPREAGAAAPDGWQPRGRSQCILMQMQEVVCVASAAFQKQGKILFRAHFLLETADGLELIVTKSLFGQAAFHPPFLSSILSAPFPSLSHFSSWSVFLSIDSKSFLFLFFSSGLWPLQWTGQAEWNLYCFFIELEERH